MRARPPLGLALALVGALLAAGCLFDGAVPAGATLVCSDASQCPTSWRCEASLCLAPGESLPELLPLSLATDEDTALVVTPGASGAALPRFVLVDAPAHGRLACSDGSEVCLDCAAPPTRCELAADGARYLPDADWSGTDLVRVAVEDRANGARRGEPGAITIEVRPVNDAPALLAALELELDEDGADAVALTAMVRDPDGDPLTFDITAPPERGVASEDDNLLVYTGLPDQWGDDQVMLRVSDGIGSIALTVPVTIASVNDPPSGANIDIVVSEDCDAFDVTALILEDAVDIDGDALALLADPGRPPNHGAVSEDGGAVTYRPAADYFGPDAFGALIIDVGEGVTPVVVRVLVEPSDDLPLALPVDVHTPEDQPAVVVLDGDNVDGTPAEYQLIDLPSHGVLSGLDATRGVALYTPDADYFGEDRFSFRLVDRETGELSAISDVIIVVEGVPDPPRVLTTHVEIPASAELVDLDVIIVDPDGDPWLDVAILHQPTHGRVTPAEDGTARLSYARERSEAFLADSFVVRVKDGLLTSTDAVVTIITTSRESCAHLQNAGESHGDDVYVVDPGERGGGDAFLAYCDMSTAGGGWTLALRADGRGSTFAYDAPAWTSGALLNADAPALLDVGEAKLASFHVTAVTELLIGFSPFTVVNGMEVPTGEFHYVRARLLQDDEPPLPSLHQAIAETTLPLATVPSGATEGTRGRERWLAAVPGMSLQDKSDRAQLNNLLSPIDHAARVGILGSDQLVPTSSKSYIGVGSNKSPSAGQRRARGPCTDVSNCNGAIGEQCIEGVCVEAMPALAVVLVRARDFSSLGSRDTCDKHAEAGAVIGGRFLVDNQPADCVFGTTEAICGDGFLDPEEECEDGNAVSGDGCDRFCQAEQCGNGRPEDNEECDDGNLTSGDGCDANCTITRCGNGVVTAGEECDNNALSGDGCDALCRVEQCGNGRVELNEQCDDGNLENGDGCESNCRRPPGGTCFVAGTLVATAEGPRPIEALAAGDRVWAGTVQDASEALISRTWRRAADHLRLLLVDGVEIRTTDEHPFFALGRGFVRAAELQPGDALATLEGRAVRVERSERLEGSFEVFNLEVDGRHTYFVSPVALLVHNKSSDPGGGPEPDPGGTAN